MFNLNDSLHYLLYNRPTDMRKSFHTLSGIVTDVMGHEASPLGSRWNGTLFKTFGGRYVW